MQFENILTLLTKFSLLRWPFSLVFCIHLGAVNFVPVGCYKNKVKGNPSRALPVLVHNYRWPRGQPEFDWNNLNKTVEACAREVRARGFLYFGIQFYGECWSGPQSHVTYDDGGPSTRCTSAGVGQALANFVYRLTGEGMMKDTDHPPCSMSSYCDPPPGLYSNHGSN